MRSKVGLDGEAEATKDRRGRSRGRVCFKPQRTREAGGE